RSRPWRKAMTPFPRPGAGQRGLVSRRLDDLGRQLEELTGRVRRAVAEVLRECLAQLARDAVDHWLAGRVPAVAWRAPPAPQPAGWGADYNPGAGDAGGWPDPRARRNAAAIEPPAPPAAPAKVSARRRCTAAVGLAAAGWWLKQRGSWWGALGVGLLA